MLYAIVALLVIIADQWVKYWVSVHVSMASAGETLIPGLISLVNVHNDGCALSMFSGGGARIYFIILTGVFTVAVIIALATNFISGKTARWSIVLVTAGGLSNCIDRVLSGYVQDMFKLELFNFPIFNVADIFITVFCIVFVIAVMFGKNPPQKYHDEFEEEDNEEEDRPKRRERKAHKKTAVSADSPAPAAASAAAPAKPRRNMKAADQYDQYKAARSSRPRNTQAQPRRGSAPVYDTADPFAEWEKANARVEAQHKNSYAAQASGVTPSYSRPQQRPAAPGRAPGQPQRRPAAPRPQSAPRPGGPAMNFEDFMQPSAPSARPAASRPQPAPRPAAPASREFEDFMAASAPAPKHSAPAAAPARPSAPQAPAPASPASETEFDLDDILNEFK